MNDHQSLDVVFLLNPYHTEEPQRSLVRCEVAAALATHFRCGFLALFDTEGSGVLRYDSWIRDRLDNGELFWVKASDHVHCRVAVILDMDTVRYLPATPSPLKAESVWIVPRIQHSSDNTTRERVARNISSYFQVPAQFHSLSGSPLLKGYVPLISHHKIVDRARFAPSSVALVGIDNTSSRASCDDLMEVLDRAVHDISNMVLRTWGNSVELPQSLISDRRCMQWEVDADSVEDFFSDLDFFVAGPATHESAVLLFPAVFALAKGAVVLAPASLEPLLGEGAIYVEWSGVARTIVRLMNDTSAYSRQSRAALRTARKRFSSELWLPRFEHYEKQLGTLIGSAVSTDRPQAPAITMSSGNHERVLMISSNGVGLGHLTRLLAVARKLPSQLEPRFLTLSEGVRLISEQGYGADYIPSFARLNLDKTSWNRLLARRVARFIQLYAPRVAVFDGNYPYAGLLDVITATPEIGWFWIRRSLWKRGRDLEALARWSYFDAVFEPSELCSNEDVGPTTTERNRVVEVPSPLLLEKDELLPRDTAREELGIRNGEICVAIQLGAGLNFDFSGIRAALIKDLQRRPGIRLFELHSPITNTALKSPDEGVQPLVYYPSVRISNGFDLMISSAGYNSFHESLYHGIPTIFVPNESYEMDDQLLRARYAESVGFALTLRANEIWRVPEVLDAAIDESFRSRSRQRSFVIENGAADIARIIEETAGSLRVGRPLSDSINRI